MDNRNALRNPCNAARCFMPYKICKKTPSDPLTSEDTEVSTKNHAIGHDTRCRCYFFWGLARSWNYHITFFALILVARFGICPSHHRMDYLTICCVQLTIKNKWRTVIRDVCFGQRRTLCKVAQVPQSMLFPLLPETEETQLRLAGSICKNTLKQSSFKLLEEFDKLALDSDTYFYQLKKMGYLMLYDKRWERETQFLDYLCRQVSLPTLEISICYTLLIPFKKILQEMRIKRVGSYAQDCLIDGTVDLGNSHITTICAIHCKQQVSHFYFFCRRLYKSLIGQKQLRLSLIDFS